MDIDLLSSYLPMDRRHALAAGRALDDRTAGAVLFTDISGFTPLTASLLHALGPQRGAEELGRLLDGVYGALLAPVHAHGGSVIGFAGDSFVALFTVEPAAHAAACALALRPALASCAAPTLPDGQALPLSIRTTVSVGPLRRFLVGDPRHQQIDVLAGGPLDRVAQAQQATVPGEVVLDRAAAELLGARLRVREWRGDLAVAAGLREEVPPAPWPPLPRDALSPEQLRPFLLPPVYQRLAGGQGEFLSELRPAVALFLRFGGLDYGRPDAGPRLDAFIRWVQEVLDRCGGALLQLVTGDKGSYLYAAFGAPVAHEDDAVRAVAAAVELRQPPPALAYSSPVQIGVSQGWVRAGSYGSRYRRTYAALGDEVNVAARLMQAAAPGEVRCSERVYLAARPRWEMEPQPPLLIKGKEQPLAVYRPRERLPETAARAVVPLVGRQAEMATLAGLLAEIGAGRRRVLLLEGEAGLGKSRLLQEFAALARGQGARFLLGAAQSIEQHTPYRAWRDLLAALFDLPEGAPRPGQQCHVQDSVRAFNPALLERLPLLNDILALDLPETALTRSFDPQLRCESLTTLVIELLRHAAEAGPLVLALEDAHWLDALSWDLALAVARALRERPVLLLLALRPLETPLLPAYETLAGLDGTRRLGLETLPAGEMVALAAARLGVDVGALPPAVAELIGERAGGNPFFAEEIAYALRDTGILQVVGGAAVLQADSAALVASVPDTIEGAVLARIDRMPPEKQLTLKVAAVIGRTFLFRTLRDIHPQQALADLLRGHLEEFARRDLASLDALEPELTYIFKHIITQQVAYETLLFAQRRELHRTVASWHERSGAENLGPYYPLLAYHWGLAEDRDQERRYARLAGERAAAQYAGADALNYLNRALELTPADAAGERYTLLLTRERVYDRQGARAAQRQDLAALERLARVLGDARRRAEVALRQASCAEATSDYAATIVLARRSVRLARVAHDDASEVAGLLRWGVALWRQGDFAGARRKVEQALRLARLGHHLPLEAESARVLGVIALDQGDLDRAEKLLDQNLQACRQAGDRQAEGRTLSNLGIVFSRRGDYAQAREHYERALGLSQEVGDRRNERIALNNLGISMQLQGDYGGARRCFEEVLRIARETGDLEGEGLALGNLGDVCDYQSDYPRAREYYREAVAISRSIGQRYVLGWMLGNLGNASTSLGQYTQAQEEYAQALQAIREMGDRQGEGFVLANQALLAHHVGDGRAAESYGRQALRLTQEVGDRLNQGYAWTNLGHALAQLGRPTEAAAAYREALEIRRQMGHGNLAAESLAGLVCAQLALGELGPAYAGVEEILPSLSAPLLEGTDDPLRIVWSCYRVLQAEQDPRAEQVLARAQRLLQEQAERIAAPAERRTFLEGIAVHREILAAAPAGPARLP